MNYDKAYQLGLQWQIATSRLGRARKSIIKWVYLAMMCYTFGFVSNHYVGTVDNGQPNVVGTATAALVCGVGWPLYWAYRLQAPADAR
jgi:hypothetical protein